VAEQLAHERLAEMHHFLVRLALGVESEPPLPPPMGRVVSAFFNTCSKARNFSVPSRTEGWKRSPPLLRPNRAVHLDPVSAIGPATSPWRSIQVTRNMMVRSGSVSRSRMRAFRYFEFFSMKGHTDLRLP